MSNWYAFVLLIGTFQFAGFMSENSCRDSEYIIEQSKKQYDPKDVWTTSALYLHIQEPRPQTPHRYSILNLDNSSGAFQLTREYDIGVIEYLIDDKGNAEIRLNGSPEISEEHRKEYRLQDERIFSYRAFYQTINGLPMSLSPEIWLSISEPKIVRFEGSDVYRIDLELKEPIISKYWTVMISVDDYVLTGLQFRHEDNAAKEDELILFEGQYSVGTMTLHRFRHWYLFDSRTYLGSDILLK